MTKNINEDRRPVFDESLFKASLPGLMVQGVRKLLSVVGDSRVHPGHGERGRRMKSVASGSSQDARKAIWRHSPSIVVEMGY